MYQERFYRKEFAKDWFSYQVRVDESDLFVKSKEELNLELIQDLVKKYREEILDYIRRYPQFKNSLSSFRLKEPASLIVKDMVEKTSVLDIGPMASVAGAIAEYVGKDLIKFSSQLIVENGGDIFIKKEGSLLLGIYAGEGNFINDFLLSIENTNSALGVCSSSSFLGHSLSLGRTDLVTVVSESTVFADALATKLANMVNEEDDLERAIRFSRKFSSVKGVLIAKREKLGIWGKISILKK